MMTVLGTCELCDTQRYRTNLMKCGECDRYFADCCASPLNGVCYQCAVAHHRVFDAVPVEELVDRLRKSNDRLSWGAMAGWLVAVGSWLVYWLVRL